MKYQKKMLAINRLYRIVAKCDEKSQPPTVVAASFLALHRNTVMLASAASLFLLIFIQILGGKRAVG